MAEKNPPTPMEEDGPSDVLDLSISEGEQAELGAGPGRREEPKIVVTLDAHPTSTPVKSPSVLRGAKSGSAHKEGHEGLSEEAETSREEVRVGGEEEGAIEPSFIGHEDSVLLDSLLGDPDGHEPQAMQAMQVLQLEQMTPQLTPPPMPDYQQYQYPSTSTQKPRDWKVKMCAYAPMGTCVNPPELCRFAHTRGELRQRSYAASAQPGPMPFYPNVPRLPGLRPRGRGRGAYFRGAQRPTGGYQPVGWPTARGRGGGGCRGGALNSVTAIKSHITLLERAVANKLSRNIKYDKETREIMNKPNGDRKQLERIKAALIAYMTGKDRLPPFIEVLNEVAKEPKNKKKTNAAKAAEAPKEAPGAATQRGGAGKRRRESEGGTEAAGKRSKRFEEVGPVPTEKGIPLAFRFKPKATEKEMKNAVLKATLAQDEFGFQIVHYNVLKHGKMYLNTVNVNQAERLMGWMQNRTHELIDGKALLNAVPAQLPMMPFRLVCQEGEERDTEMLLAAMRERNKIKGKLEICGALPEKNNLKAQGDGEAIESLLSIYYKAIGEDAVKAATPDFAPIKGMLRSLAMEADLDEAARYVGGWKFVELQRQQDDEEEDEEMA